MRQLSNTNKAYRSRIHDLRETYPEFDCVPDQLVELLDAVNKQCWAIQREAEAEYRAEKVVSIR